MSHAHRSHVATGGCHECPGKATKGRRCDACTVRHRERERVRYQVAKSKGRFVR
jgi:hypothetical protein